MSRPALVPVLQVGHRRASITLYGNGHTDAVSINPDPQEDSQDYSVFLSLSRADCERLQRLLGEALKSPEL